MLKALKEPGIVKYKKAIITDISDVRGKVHQKAEFSPGKRKANFEAFERYVKNAELNQKENDVIMLKYVMSEMKTRQELLVTNAIVFENMTRYVVCPNCKTTMDRDFQAYCDRCGQKLKWPSFKKINCTMKNMWQ